MFLAVAGAIATSLIVGTLFNYRRASRIDPLTGLRNRMDFSETLAREVERSRRHARLLSLVILDLDHFKRINDQFKHAAGDDLLCAVASELDRTVRKTDSVYRYGGEEFAILLPETNNESARVVIDRVRERFAAQAARPRALGNRDVLGRGRHVGSRGVDRLAHRPRRRGHVRSQE